MGAVTELDVYAIGVPIILAMILVEVLVSVWNKSDLYEWQDTLGTLGLLAGNIFVSLLVKTTILGFYLWLYQFRLFDLSMLLPPWALWLLTFVLIDLTFYIYHRCSHRSRFLWAIHMNHHSSECMNFVVAFRQAWLGPVSKVPFFFILPLIGLDPLVTLIAGVVSTLWGVVGHTRIIKTLGPLEYIFNTPSHHRVHHGSNPEYIDKNYGNLFIVWDRLFGTFEAEKDKVIYGLVNNVETQNPLSITLMGWKTLYRDISKSGSLSQALKHAFMPPDWQPSVSEDTLEDLDFMANKGAE
jgi:sterol desaturase/sphingolipid hydroxylase (fatty acid hydroxylase superfamily)